MTEKQLSALGRRWQRVLRLEDWTIDYTFRRKHAMDIRETDVMAEVHWVEPKKVASIHVMDPIDQDPSCIVPFDIEVSIIHELLHLHTAPLDIEKAKSTAEEQAINAIAYALVSLKRWGLAQSTRKKEKK